MRTEKEVVTTVNPGPWCMGRGDTTTTFPESFPTEPFMMAVRIYQRDQ